MPEERRLCRCRTLVRPGIFCCCINLYILCIMCYLGRTSHNESLMPLYNHYPRLPQPNYLGHRTYFVTICCHNRRSVFTDLEAGQGTVEILKQSTKKQLLSLHAYCLMPDHLHFMVEGREEKSDLAKLVISFKQRSAFYHRTESPLQLWQNRFYEHILRSADSAHDVACYIWMNPVRANLCVNPSDYALSGSQTIDWMKQDLKVSTWTPPWKKSQAGLKSGAYTSNTDRS
jgi:putative transposase